MTYPKDATLQRPPLEDTSFDELTVVACMHWKRGDNSCPNEPVWVGRRPCCGTHGLFCGPCRHRLEATYAERELHGRGKNIRCAACKTNPCPNLEFHPA